MSSEKRIPLNGTFELTGRCNLQCKMCLMRVDHRRIRDLGLRERTAAEWIGMAEQAAQAGTLELLLTGGEVLLRPDFCEIYDAISRMGFLLTVYTNATLVDDEVMKLFRVRPPHKIGITMYGSSNETYQRLCGSANGYDRFMEGFRRLNELPSVMDIRTTIVKDNAQDLTAMQEFTANVFGSADRLHISRFISKAVRDGICKPEEVRLSAKECAMITESWMLGLAEEVKVDPLKKYAFLGMRDRLERTEPTALHSNLFHSCRAGVDQYAINWAGRMYACELLTAGYTDPFETGFAEAWEHLTEQYPENRRIEKCEKCVNRNICETCPANRLAETGEWFGVPKYACEEAAWKRSIYRQIGAME